MKEQKEEAKDSKIIDEKDALKCLEDTVNIMTSMLPDDRKKSIAESLLAGLESRSPKFDYLEQFKNDIEEKLMLLSQKESDAQLQIQLIEEKFKKMQSFIEMQEAIKKNLPEAFAGSGIDLEELR